MSSVLLDTEKLRQKILEELSFSSEILLISAYVTESAVIWLEKNAQHLKNVTIVGRITPYDLYNKSSSIVALKRIVNQGWDLKALSNLHAKIYLLDKRKMFVGSANFTSNGLKLYGEGNLEASVEIDPTEDNISFANNILTSAQPIDIEIINKMELYIKEDVKLEVKNKGLDCWPEDIIPRDLSIWVADFPWVDLVLLNNDEASLVHDKNLFGEHNEKFLGSKSYRWLKMILNEQDKKEIYYGELTAKLHDDLKDDPAPYRKDVKMLLSNLLAYCNKYADQYIEIDRPNHSQRISLKNEHSIA